MTAERDAVAMAVSMALKHPDAHRAGRTRILTHGSVTAFALSMGLIATASAQEGGQPAASDDTLEEITVTGSRIVRKDFEATSPIVTVGTEQFEQTSTIALEANLNKLPQFTPAVTQFVTQDVQNTATNTVGASTVSLRGLGPNRNLVLLDGRRAMPINASMVVDINSIPSAAIERVEIITGGASSVYGADAVGGVVNFILKKDFQGVEFDSQYGTTELGDGEEFRVTGLVGANFADGRGNVMFGAEHTRRLEATQLERDFYVGRMRDPTVAPTEFFYSDTSFAPDFFNAPQQPILNGIFNQAAPGAISPFGALFVNKDGTLYTGGNTFGAGDPDGVYRYNGILDGQFRRLSADGTIGENQQSNLASTPLKRYSLFGRASFELTDKAAFFVQGNFNKNDTESILQFSPASNGWSVNIPYGTGIYAPSVDPMGNTLPQYLAGGTLGLNCPATGGCTNSQAFPVSPELATVLNSRPNNNASWQLNRVLDFLGPRGSVNDSLNYQILAGFSGSLRDDWTWETYLSHGETTVQIGLRGFADLQRYRAVVTSPNFGRNFFVTGNQGAPGNGFAAATGACTSGLPIFGDFEVSDDCKASLGANLQNNTEMEQNVIEANLQGGLFDMPAGQLRFALGSAFRENDFRYQTDILTSQESFLAGGIGLFPAGNSSGSTEVTEIYGELLVPLLTDVPGFKNLNLELGYRFSDYDTVGGVSTYKGLLDWRINDSFRFRGGHQLASRAPNIGELFLARTQSVAFSSFGDFCSQLATAPSGANPAINPNAAQAEGLCRQLMGATGAQVYYANPQAPGGFSLALPNTIGNPNLDQEEATSFTAGFVFQSRSDSAALRRLRASVDWYSIEIEDAIGAVSVDTVFDQCLNIAFNPTFDPTAPACQQIVRDPNNGGPGSINVSYTNQGLIETSGVDLQVDYGLDLKDMGIGAPGSLSINFLLNWVDSFTTQANAGSPTVEWVGTLGPDTPGLNPGVYDFKAFTTLSYFNGPVGASLRWRYLPSADSTASATAPNTTVSGTDSYSIVDLSATWQLSERFTLRGGIDNVFDTEPNVFGRNSAIVMNGGSFDTLPGYYDVLGRRYYFGVKARF
jgi:iron complex outermembrane receptor protein